MDSETLESADIGGKRATRLLGIAPDDETIADIIADRGKLTEAAFGTL